MRFIIMMTLGSVLALSGCGNDGGSSGTGGSGGPPGGGGTAPPTITMVAWATTATCAGPTDYTVTVTASDPDTDAGDLTYSGSVGGCTGALDDAVSTINCPNVALYPGDVIVSDPDGNDSAPVAFDIDVCETSSCTTDPDTCTR